jgi:hypothetical protein
VIPSRHVVSRAQSDPAHEPAALSWQRTWPGHIPEGRSDSQDPNLEQLLVDVINDVSLSTHRSQSLHDANAEVLPPFTTRSRGVSSRQAEYRPGLGHAGLHLDQSAGLQHIPVALEMANTRSAGADEAPQALSPRTLEREIAAALGSEWEME